MSKILVYLNNELVQERELDKERVVVGRLPDNDVSLPHPTVSGHHAMFISIRNDTFLEDLGSTNGTKVNNMKVNKYLLQDGDEIKVGRYVIKYLFEPQGMVLEEDSTDTVPSIEPGHKPVVPDDKTVAASYLATQRMQAGDTTLMQQMERPGALEVLSGPSAGRELLLSRVITTLGKPGIQVVEITRTELGYTLSHLEGESYPALNGQPIGAKPITLKSGDMLELAGIQMRFSLK
jgi:pSer/pThr/pTyr-binding forkhead associated (FHA) protein